ncbi:MULTISPECIES: TetR/AcrR family transcriptional regulator [Cedecea]|uniref:Transcriptional regulator, TetR family n=1 Tax=Cedecea davisae DSM 4568 TaxID=566551 RepID=S3IV62_9ENTR|nr:MULTISPECIES: TetR/AcrR family transcriptional regulator [Cedecea]EPF17608.1 transcriptional regulator, TetR family [Cedecea davisae DSM 4568]QIX97995.1 TetR/AcrR family transcriptional regulator [Cedecea sp. FDAARGOS_727]SUX27824.1 transcriptional regulator BetI [Cedecea davisae]
MSDTSVQAAETRGPAEHNVREQIIHAATDFFGHYGFEKTTVSDLAKAIGYSKAYIYKFFKSKQEIGEVICDNRLTLMIDRVSAAVNDANGASAQLRAMFSELIAAGSDLFFYDRKLHDIAIASCQHNWPSAERYKQQLKIMLANIIQRGRQSGEFERRSPLDETVDAVFLVMLPFINPVQLQYNLDLAKQAEQQLPALILKSLMP